MTGRDRLETGGFPRLWWSNLGGPTDAMMKMMKIEMTMMIKTYRDHNDNDEIEEDDEEDG